MDKEQKIIILISCASKKHSTKMPAKDLYNSILFKSSLEYAKSIKHDKIYILSAKHHLLDLETQIERLKNHYLIDDNIFIDDIIQLNINFTYICLQWLL